MVVGTLFVAVGAAYSALVASRARRWIRLRRQAGQLMRVVAGEAKGRRLQAPKGDATRPTSDRVREAIFDVLGSLGGVERPPRRRPVRRQRGPRHRGPVPGSHPRRAGRPVAGRGRRHPGQPGRHRAGRRGPTWSATTWPDGPSGPVPVDLVLCDPPYAFTGWEPLLAAFWPLCDLAVFESAEAIDPGERWRVLREKRYGGTVVTVARPEQPSVTETNWKGDT